MVEGPGATRNGRKIIRAVNRQLIDIQFQCNSSVDASIFAGRYLSESFVVGKELFLIFASFVSVIRDDHGAGNDVEGEAVTNEVALRLHFGMNGCLYVGGSSGQANVPQWRRTEAPSLRLLFGSPLVQQQSLCLKRKRPQFSSDKYTKIENNISMVFEARRTTVAVVSVKTARNKLIYLASYDVCSSTFNANQVYERLCLAKCNTRLIISDAILDQGIFPGVGNIIKVEGLHKAKVDPRRTVASLEDVDIRRVVAFCRQYSLGWLKNGRAPTKFVYNKTICGTCKNSSVLMQKLGGGTSSSSISDNSRHYMSRVTFWCRYCQPISKDMSSNDSDANLDLKTNNIMPIDQQQSNTMGAVYCPQHGTDSVVIRRVRKPESANFSHLFHTCRRKDCQFFMWADLRFPQCLCGKRAVLKVSKTAHSGGRWFFSCAQGVSGKGTNHTKRGHDPPHNQGCKLFKWAEQTHLDQLGSSLTPLL